MANDGLSKKVEMTKLALEYAPRTVGVLRTLVSAG